MNELMDNLVELSHEFGTSDYLKGGGGNTSVKDAQTLWIKPSGTTLLDMTPDSFVAVEREKLGKLYDGGQPEESTAREAWVKDIMTAAVRPDSSGRPSVEAPVHNLFDATYVVHTHPPLVNGVTCSRKGKETCARFFPDALWIDYTDPGYTVCVSVMDRMQVYTEERGCQPQVVFLENHGVFVAGNSPEEIRELYAEIMERLKAEYRHAGISMDLEIDPDPPWEMADSLRERLLEVSLMSFATSIKMSGYFTLAEGPLSPDQIVYMRSYPLIGAPTRGALTDFIDTHGYAPRVISFESGVFGLGDSDRNASLALELAQDAALVRQLTAAFGGPKYMTDEQGNFIDKWEVEAYRRKLVK